MDKCSATGKSIFHSKGHALEQMIKFKSFSKLTINGRRIKHRTGKPEQCRIYHCSYCDGYHLTKHKKHNKYYD